MSTTRRILGGHARTGDRLDRHRDSSRVLRQLPGATGRSRAPEDAASALAAQLSLEYFRSLRISTQQWLVVLAAPLWVEARVALVPVWLGQACVLLTGPTLALSLVYCAMEHVWWRRITRQQSAASANVHLAWTRRAQLRSGLLYAMSALTMLPSWAAALGVRLPVELLSPVTRVWMLLLFAQIGAEVIPHLSMVRSLPGRSRSLP